MTENIDGQVVSLHLNVAHREAMQSVPTAAFIADVGIENDRHATSKVERRGYQVLVADKETLDSLDLQPGMIKENVTTTGIEVADLRPGQQLALGDEVLIEVSKACAPCSRMEELRPGLQNELEGRRGMLAGVVRGGEVRVGGHGTAGTDRRGPSAVTPEPRWTTPQFRLTSLHPPFRG